MFECEQNRCISRFHKLGSISRARRAQHISLRRVQRIFQCVRGSQRCVLRAYACLLRKESAVYQFVVVAVVVRRPLIAIYRNFNECLWVHIRWNVIYVNNPMNYLACNTEAHTIPIINIFETQWIRFPISVSLSISDFVVIECDCNTKTNFYFKSLIPFVISPVLASTFPSFSLCFIYFLWIFSLFLLFLLFFIFLSNYQDFPKGHLILFRREKERRNHTYNILKMYTKLKILN